MQLYSYKGKSKLFFFTVLKAVRAFSDRESSQLILHASDHGHYTLQFSTTNKKNVQLDQGREFFSHN